jgi:hypothetical protein
VLKNLEHAADTRGMRSRLLLAVLGTAAAAATGCGSTSKPMDSQTVVSCLQAIPGATVSTAKSDLDLIAEKAQRGAATVRLGSDSATVVVEASSPAAADTVKQYKVFAARFGGRVKQNSNVVTAWDKAPAGGHEKAVAACVQ